MIADITFQLGKFSIELGAELGAIIAVVCSWQRNRSVLLAIVAGILSWLYVIYFIIVRREDERPKDWKQEEN